MAKPYPIVPLSFVDGLNHLNASLMTYHMAVEGLLRRFATDGAPNAYETVIAGLDNLFQPVLEGYQDIEAQCSMGLKMGMRGIVTLDESDPEKP
jgi:hypothetical protein